MASIDPPHWVTPGPAFSNTAPPPPPPAHPYGPPVVPFPPPPRSSALPLVVAVVAVVVSVLALLGAGVAFAMSASGLAVGLDEDTGYGAYSLSGQLTSHAAGTGVSAAELTASLTFVLEDDGSDVDTLVCPATAKVTQGVVTPCHGVVDGDEWAVVVIFDGSDGRYLALLS